MRIGYARVSTLEQHEARQLAALSQQGCEKIYIDKQSGKSRDRTELKKMLDFVREGDTVVVLELSRLARSTRDLLDILDELSAKKVDFISLKENFDTGSPNGRFVLTIFAALAELERGMILERQKEGIEIARAAGKYKGRPEKEYDEAAFRRECNKWISGEQSAKESMKKLGMLPNRFYRLAKKHGFHKKSVTLCDSERR